MFGIEALNLNASQLNNIDNLIYNAFGKIFKTFDHSCLNWCMFYVNCWPLKYEYYNRRVRFLKDFQHSNNYLCKMWYALTGCIELSNLKDKLNITRLNNFDIREAI